MKNRFRKLVPVTIAGITTQLDAASIATSNWTAHHGKTAAGNKVNSLSSVQVGKTTILNMPGTNAFFSVPTDDLEVAAAQMLAGFGYTVTPPNSGH